MPKMKTHQGTAKRMKITSTGKVLRRRASGNHILAKKSKRRKRIIGSMAQVTGKQAINVKKVMGI